jgi:hypothetical protein
MATCLQDQRLRETTGKPTFRVPAKIVAAWYRTFIAPVYGRLQSPSLAASDAPDRRRSVGATFVKP